MTLSWMPAPAGGYMRGIDALRLKPSVRPVIQPAMNMNPTPSRTLSMVSWLCQLVAAGILLQTLFFKFTAAPESVYIFSTLGLEPVGRIGSGIAELIAAALLLIPGAAALGALLAMSVMAGAIMSHLTVLGIDVQGDHGLLFGLAITVFVCATAVLVIRRAALPVVGRVFRTA